MMTKARRNKVYFLPFLLMLLAIAIVAGPAFAEEAHAEEYVTLGNTSDAAVYLTEHMTAREESISIAFPVGGKTPKEAVRDVYDSALAHTGIPDQGDYLKNTYASMHYNYTTDGSDVEVTYTVRYRTTAEQEEAVGKRIDELRDELNIDELDDFGKIKAIYGYITSHVKYDYDNLNNPDYPIKYTAYAALFDGKAVCEGFTLLFYRMALTYGVDSRVIIGTSMYSDRGHAWNLACIDGLYYNLDCTWDAGGSPTTYVYFLKNDAAFQSSHFRKEEFADEAFYQAYPMGEKNYALPIKFGDKVYTDEVSSGEVYSYKVSEEYGVALITAYQGDDDWILVPGQMGDYPVYAVGENVFDENCKAKEIVFSSGIKGWFCDGGSSFHGCPNLTLIDYSSSIGLGDGSEYDIYSHADLFHACPNLKTILVSEEDPHFTVVDDVLFTKDQKTLVYYPGGLTESSYIIPDGTTEIGQGAFRDAAKLLSIYIPASVTEMDPSLFSCSDEVKISGPAGSAAEAFAQENGYGFYPSEHAHDYVTDVTPATLSSNGKMVMRCSICGSDLIEKTIYSPSDFQLSESSYVYDRKKKKPEVTITDTNGATVPSSCYTVTYEDNRMPGTASVQIEFKDQYSGTKVLHFTIEKLANNFVCKGWSGTVKVSGVKKAAKTIARKKAIIIKKGVGKVTYTKVSGDKKIKINKGTGDITVKKGLKKGTYKLVVKVRSAGDAYHKAKTVTVTVKIRVR